MMIPFVVDANVMNYFQRDRILGGESEAICAVNQIVSGGYIALDADGFCQAEWLECAGGTFPLALKDWIADMMASEVIRLFSFKCDSMHKELSNLGVPKKDHKWVRLARSAEAKYLVTEDIDLIDPTKKNSSSAAKKALKKKCKGPVSKYLKKNYAISVCCCCHVEKIFAED